MSDIQDVLLLIGNKLLTGVLVVGYLDPERRPPYKMFIPLLETMYLKFEDKLLKCSSINQYDQLKLDVVDEVAPGPDFFPEEYGELCVGSMSDFFTGNAYSGSRVDSFVAFLDYESKLELGIVRGAEFDLGQHGLIFLDPIHVFGVLPHTCAQQRDDWIEWEKCRYEKAHAPAYGLQRVRIDLGELLKTNIEDLPREKLCGSAKQPGAKLREG